MTRLFNCLLLGSYFLSSNKSKIIPDSLFTLSGRLFFTFWTSLIARLLALLLLALQTLTSAIAGCRKSKSFAHHAHTAYLQLVWLFTTTSSRASHCSQPISAKWFISGRKPQGKEVRHLEHTAAACTHPHLHGQPLRVWRISRAMQGRWSAAGAWVRSTHCARRDPSSPGPKAQLSRTRRTGAQNLQASHC